MVICLGEHRPGGTCARILVHGLDHRRAAPGPSAAAILIPIGRPRLPTLALRAPPRKRAAIARRILLHQLSTQSCGRGGRVPSCCCCACAAAASAAARRCTRCSAAAAAAAALSAEVAMPLPFSQPGALVPIVGVDHQITGNSAQIELGLPKGSLANRPLGLYCKNDLVIQRC